MRINKNRLKKLDASSMQGKIIALALAGLAVAAIGSAAVWFFTCPCERMPGAYLSGEQVEEPIADWSFANEVALCQIETRSGLLPHAINLNCMADDNGDLFLSCSQCEGKRWSTAALENPAARIRLNGTVYPINLRRLSDAPELDSAWRTRALKLARLRGQEISDIGERPNHWWSFEVTSRSG